MQKQENIVDSVVETLERTGRSLGGCNGVKAQKAAANIDKALEGISQINNDQYNSYRP